MIKFSHWSYEAVHDFIMAIPYMPNMKPLILYLVAFGTSAFESIPVLGTFTPGTLFLLLFGFVSTHEKVSILILIIAVSSGGVLGDIVGYLCGKYGLKHLNKFKLFSKYANVSKGEAFFHKHGGKSVLFARFIGPIRPIVPVFAGMIKMKFRKFLFWNVLGAVLWATTYICIGYILGANFKMFAMWASRAGIGAFIVVLLLLTLYGWKEKQTQKVLDKLESEIKD